MSAPVSDQQRRDASAKLLDAAERGDSSDVLTALRMVFPADDGWYEWLMETVRVLPSDGQTSRFVFAHFRIVEGPEGPEGKAEIRLGDPLT